MNKFKEGDKVEVFQNGSTSKSWVGVQGIVKEVLTFGGYHVELTETAKTGEKVGYVAFLTGHNLKLVEEPKPFTFTDIQVGDTIRRTMTRESGAKEIREGTVSKLASWYAEDNGYILAYDTDTADAEDVTLELLNRPEPVKKPWEDATLGTVITRGADHLIRNEKGWAVLYADGTFGQFDKDDAKVLARPDSKVLHGI